MVRICAFATCIFAGAGTHAGWIFAELTFAEWTFTLCTLFALFKYLFHISVA